VEPGTTRAMKATRDLHSAALYEVALGYTMHALET